MNKNYKILSAGFLKTIISKSVLSRFLLLIMFISSTVVFAQNTRIVKGRIMDEKSEPLLGATVKVKDSSTGVITDANGQFSLNVPANMQVLTISYIGYDSQEINISGKTNITVTMKDNSTQMGEVVVVGYGQQTKASVVGSITQTSGKVLERAGGVSSLGAALTGNLPGVVTMQTTGKPGEEDPQIIIRGISSWNSSSPLILVDGIERAMNSVDINSVESISVLKDASATAVYGVRGANGVILITTKRGVEGKARIDIGFSSTMKAPSQLPNKMDSYDALTTKNNVIEYELNNYPAGWNYERPQSFISMYRNQTTQAQRERYPNIDWQKLLIKDYTMSYTANINISGGNKVVKYFAAIDFLSEGDLVNQLPNSKGYTSGYGYNRINSRANMDFQLTQSTKFLVNLSGSYGQTKKPMNQITEGYMFAAAYSTPPDIFYPLYSNGAWGWLPANQVDGVNTLENQAYGGRNLSATTRITTDFTLNQDLSMFLKGLSAKATVSLDNSFLEDGRGINNNPNASPVKETYQDPVTGIWNPKNLPDGTTNVDYYPANNWFVQNGTAQNYATYRNLNYSAQVLYNGRFGDHSVTGMGNFARQEQASGSNLPSYREDYVFRTTYNYKSKYFIEYNGAYNGSEKFGPANRFGFFSSGALGWMISEEKFMKKLTFLDMLKLRASIGQIGDDNVNGRWLYMDTYNNGTSQAMVGTTASQGELSPYRFYTQSQLGNPNIAWESVLKRNIGADFAIFKNLFAGSIDIYHDNRSNILLPGSSRAVPTYLGFNPPVVNIGAVEVSGYELELRYSQRINKDLRLWANASMTHGVDKIINKDDPALYPEYIKKAGYPNNQITTVINHGFYNTWDQLYGTSPFESLDGKIPGNFNIIDFNSDGSINADKDKARYGFPTNPQNTFNETFGVDWKGFSAFVQFYGVNDVSRYISTGSFKNGTLPYFNNVYKDGIIWNKNNASIADTPTQRVSNSGLNPSIADGARYWYDGSYVRLKNAEVSYTFDSKWIKSIGIQSLRIFLNGNNLLLWTKTPDDREINGGTGYPTVRRYNLGLKLTL